MDSSTHPADGDLRALLDGELPSAHRLEIEQHRATCQVCRARLEALESASRETAELLNLLPSPAPKLRIESIVSRARGPQLRRGAIAAGLALFIATVAGATVGRPYVRALVEHIRAVVRPAPPSPPPPPQLRVVLADTSKLVIDPTAAVTYRVHPGGVVVHNRGSEASYDVLVPRYARHVRIRVAGRILFEKTESSITATAPVDDTGGYVFQLR